MATNAIDRRNGAGTFPDKIDLSGSWEVRLDPRDEGGPGPWFNAEPALKIHLPGSLMEAGIGDPISTATVWVGDINEKAWYTDEKYAEYRKSGNVKMPCWLQPDRHYMGAAWYRRVVDIPESFRSKRIVLSLERVHWESRAWADGVPLGVRDSLSSPHEYDLSLAGPGRHVLVLRVENRMLVPVGPNAHSVSDHTQGNWNGIVGAIALRAVEKLGIECLVLYPSAKNKAVRVVAELRGNDEVVDAAADAVLRGASLELAVHWANTPDARAIASKAVPVVAETSASPTRTETSIALGDDVPLWDEFSPNMLRLRAVLRAADGRVLDARETDFGLRDISTIGTNFAVNGRKTFLRGTLECCVFPRTGYPPTEVAEWKRVLGIAKACGLNHIRFHSWCPPEAAFVAGDELGLYFQVEAPVWANQGTVIGDGTPLDEWIHLETKRILDQYGNHPSFALMASGNEPDGKGHAAFLAAWVARWRNSDPRRLYTTAAGWPVHADSDYHSYFEARIQFGELGMKSRINAKVPETSTKYDADVASLDKPIVSHEIGQWCAFPDFDEIRKYDGVLKARNLEIFRESLAAAGMADLARDFLMASGKLQALCYKEEIESALRTRGFGGFQLLGLTDFPGQGTALVGMLNAFWEEKGYLSINEFYRFCAPVVPLALLPKRYWLEGESLDAEAIVSNFGPGRLPGAILSWRLEDEAGTVLRRGELPKRDIPVGGGISLGRFGCSFDGLQADARYRLFLTLDGGRENDWDLWFFKRAEPAAVPEGVLVADELDGTAEDRLRAGGTVVLLPRPETLHTPVPFGFSPAFWNTAWMPNQAPFTLGALIREKHPALASFPTSYHSDWQWQEIFNRSAALPIDTLSSGVENIIQPIDTWFRNRRLSVLFQARVLAGKLFVCTMDIERNLNERPAACALRRSIMAYVGSCAFNPTALADADEVAALLKKKVDRAIFRP